MHRRIAAILTLTLFPVTAWSVGTWQASTSNSHVVAPVTLAPSWTPVSNNSGIDDGSSTNPSPVIEEPAAERVQDIYGNDVSPAIASYKSDGSGSVYEEHSPDTEVARLRPPTT